MARAVVMLSTLSVVLAARGLSEVHAASELHCLLPIWWQPANHRHTGLMCSQL